MALILKGAPVANALLACLRARVSALAAQTITPTLALVQVGADSSALSYARAIDKRCSALGARVQRFEFDENVSMQELRSCIEGINHDPRIHGCIIFRPLPHGLDERSICAELAYEKDLDGIGPGSLYGVFAGERIGFPPCTAEACLKLLDHYGIELEGKRVCVLGRSLVIGRPVSLLMQARDATVTMCHSKTRDLAEITREADIVVVAIGHANFVTEDMLSPGQVVLDVGINWDARAQKLVGDCDFQAIEEKVAAITPVPGGIGSITTAVLMEHLVTSAERSISA